MASRTAEPIQLLGAGRHSEHSGRRAIVQNAHAALASVSDYGAASGSAVRRSSEPSRAPGSARPLVDLRLLEDARLGFVLSSRISFLGDGFRFLGGLFFG